jgi:hypothetical protein
MTGATTGETDDRRRTTVEATAMSSGEQHPAHSHPAHSHPAHSHGNSVAAWTAVTIICLGFVIGAIAFPLGSAILFWVGIAVSLLGIVAGKVLAMMGFGVSVPGHPIESATVTDP